MAQTDKTPLDQPSSYMGFLPAIYREGEIDGRANLLGRFLKISEKLLTGINDDVQLQNPQADPSIAAQPTVGIEEILARIHNYFDPFMTPPFGEGAPAEEFLAYVASWVALTFNQNWPESRKRRVLSRIVPLYKKRGTKEGLSEYLRIFVGPNVKIEEGLQGLQIGFVSTVGEDTIIGGAPPYFFFVRITLGADDLTPDKVSPVFFRGLVQLTTEIIDLEKPAHTYYSIRYDVPGIIVGMVSHVGVNTLIGSRSIPRFIF